MSVDAAGVLMKGAVSDILKEHPEAEVQTDKPVGKAVLCRECNEKPVVVNSFYAPANARCSACKGEEAGERGLIGTVAAPQPGRTDPAKAVSLADCLINSGFAKALCPVHPDDEEHVMELKMVSHSDHYGPSQLTGYDARGRPEYRQLETGETVMHQCLHCKATVSYSTTAQTQFARQNEVRSDKHVNGHAAHLGSRREEVVE